MWHSIIESPNKGIFGDVNIFWGCVFEQLSPNLLSFKIPSISYDRRTPTPSVLSHRGEDTPSNVASIAEPNTNLFDCPTLVPTTQHSAKETNTPQMTTQNKKNCQRHNGHQGIIEYFDSFNTFSSKQKLQQALKSWSKFSLALFCKGGEIHRGTLTNPCNNWEKFMYQCWQIHIKTPCMKYDKSIQRLREINVAILTNPCNNFEKSIYQFWQIYVTT